MCDTSGFSELIEHAEIFTYDVIYDSLMIFYLLQLDDRERSSIIWATTIEGPRRAEKKSHDRRN